MIKIFEPTVQDMLYKFGVSKKTLRKIMNAELTDGVVSTLQQIICLKQ